MENRFPVSITGPRIYLNTIKVVMDRNPGIPVYLILQMGGNKNIK